MASIAPEGEAEVLSADLKTRIPDALQFVLPYTDRAIQFLMADAHQDSLVTSRRSMAMAMYRRLLVTGHLGFIGSGFCEAFHEKYEITGVDFRGWGSMEQNLAPGVKDIEADIADEARITSILEDVRPDAIVNFAAESHVDRANEDDSCFWKSNVIGVRNLALQASRRGIRLVHVSTDEVYGDAKASAEPWTESSPIAPKNPYAVTKAAAEMLLRAYCESDRLKLDVVITRGANTIGLRQFPEKAVPKAISHSLNGRPFPLYRTPAERCGCTSTITLREWRPRSCAAAEGKSIT